MTRKKLSREEILKESLASSIKPRFCYMGYAPPLCIGDEYRKSISGQNGQENPRPILVGSPKKGKGPDSFFSFESSLCLGDPYTDSLSRIQEVKSSGGFKPSGRAPDSLLGKLEYIGSPALSPCVSVSKKKARDRTRRAFICSASSTSLLFQPRIEYFSSLETEGARKRSESSIPFKVGRFISPSEASEYLSPGPSDDPKRVHKKDRSTKSFPFIPGGGRVPLKHPVHMSESIDGDNSKRREPQQQVKPRWIPGSVALVSSPHPSIEFNSINLKPFST